MLSIWKQRGYARPGMHGTAFASNAPSVQRYVMLCVQLGKRGKGVHVLVHERKD